MDCGEGILGEKYDALVFSRIGAAVAEISEKTFFEKTYDVIVPTKGVLSSDSFDTFLTSFFFFFFFSNKTFSTLLNLFDR